MKRNVLIIQTIKPVRPANIDVFIMKLYTTDIMAEIQEVRIMKLNVGGVHILKRRLINTPKCMERILTRLHRKRTVNIGNKEGSKMGRLTDKELFDALNEHEKDCCRCRERICTYESDRHNCLQDKDKKAYKELAEYRRLEEQGLLLKLPCNVGDVVWHERKNSHLSGVHPYQITNVMISQNKKGEWTRKYRAMRLLNGKTIDSQINFEFDQLGKTVFLTKEEAEKALEKLEG
jgi:hypothetical protein